MGTDLLFSLNMQKFDLDIAPGLAAAGQDLSRLHKGQRCLCVADFTLYQPRTAGATVAFAALELHLVVMRFQRCQQVRVILSALQPRAAGAEGNEGSHTYSWKSSKSFSPTSESI